jgi:hypothetical protein
MDYISRAQWGAQAPTWNPGRVSPALGMFIHYNGPPVSNAVLAGDYESVKRFLQGIQRYHINTNKWPDIAYSWCVDSMGRIWELRGWDVAQAATLDWNWKSHSIFLPIGGDQAPTPEQVEGCKRVIAEANKRYGAQFVKGHQEAPNQTSCPGEPTMRLIRAAAFIPGRPAVTPTPPRPTPSPTPTPAPTLPIPPGVDPKMNKPTMMQEPDGTVWMYYSGTPWRVHVKSPADVNAFKYMGVEYKVVDRTQAAFFRRYSQEVKCA